MYIYVYFKIDEYLDFYTLHRTKFVSDDWMVNMGYMETAVDEKDKWLDTCTCKSYECVFLKLNKHGIDQIPVVNSDGLV